MPSDDEGSDDDSYESFEYDPRFGRPESLAELLQFNATHEEAEELLGEWPFDCNRLIVSLEETFAETADLYLAQWLQKIPADIRGFGCFYYQRMWALLICAMHDGNLDKKVDMSHLMTQSRANNIDDGSVWFELDAHLYRVKRNSSAFHHKYFNKIFVPRMYYLLLRKMLQNFISDSVGHFPMVCSVLRQFQSADFGLAWQLIKDIFLAQCQQLHKLTGYWFDIDYQRGCFHDMGAFPLISDSCQFLMKESEGQYKPPAAPVLSRVFSDAGLFALRHQHPGFQRAFDRRYGLIPRPKEKEVFFLGR
jgi:hypothetical protein